jgi:hypothetical protein
MDPVDLLLVSGSLQRVSANRALLEVAAQCADGLARVSWYARLGELPHFDPDLPEDLAPALIVGQLSVPGIRPKLDANGAVADPETMAQTCALLRELAQAARTSRAAP